MTVQNMTKINFKIKLHFDYRVGQIIQMITIVKAITINKITTPNNTTR